MSEINSIGLVELSSVATGFLVEDTMLKAGSVKLLMARSICSGKFLVVVSGDVASVAAALEAGGAVAGATLIEKRQIARLHPTVLQAISMSVDVDPRQLRSIGVVETFSAASIIEAADAAVKSANVTLLRRNARGPGRDSRALRRTLPGLYLGPAHNATTSVVCAGPEP